MRIRAHAKINLDLAVMGSRPDGYHELRTTFQSLALHDTLMFEPWDGLALDCDDPGVPLDDRNLAWKAAQLVWRAAGRAGRPAGRVRILKRIPAQGGLGGGSADGAAALVGWNRLWDARLEGEALCRLAAELGADVPFFLCAGTARGTGRGDVIEPLPDAPARSVVLVVPGFGVPTPQAFTWWDEDRALAARAPGGAAPVVAGTVVNDLEAPVRRRHPVLGEIRDRLLGEGAGLAAMTGSGSTMFGVFADRADAARAARRLRDPRWRVVLTRTAARAEAAPDLQPAGASRPLVSSRGSRID